MTAFGTGVLVGTSLIIIIPEGIETLYEASEDLDSYPDRSMGLAVRSVAWTNAFPGSYQHDVWRQGTAIPANVDLEPEDDPVNYYTKRQDSTVPTSDSPDADEEEDNEEEDESSHNPHTWVGLSLISGFILMYLIDQLPRHATTPSRPQSFPINLTSFSLTRTRTSSNPTSNSVDVNPHSSDGTRTTSVTTLGLVLHALADGIALGASSTTTSSLTFVIFIALMLHKAPAAFGLTTALLKQNLSKRTARGHLIVFALAAPIGALLTWGAAHIFGYTSATLGSSMDAEFATGVALLFSGGTFLYVAMDGLKGGHDHDHGSGGVNGNGYVGVPMSEMSDVYASVEGGQAGMKREEGGLVDTIVTVVGMGVPLLMSFGHAH